MSEELPEYKISPTFNSISRSLWVKYNDKYYVSRAPFFRIFYGTNYTYALNHVHNHDVAENFKDRALDLEYNKLFKLMSEVYNISRISGLNSFFDVNNALKVIEFVKTGSHQHHLVIDIKDLKPLRKFINKLFIVDVQVRERIPDQPKFNMENLFNHRLRLTKKLEYVKTDRFKRFADQIFNEYMEDGRKRNREYLESQPIEDNDLKDEVRNDPRIRRMAISMAASNIRVSFDHIYKVRLPFKKQKQ